MKIMIWLVFVSLLSPFAPKTGIEGGWVPLYYSSPNELDCNLLHTLEPIHFLITEGEFVMEGICNGVNYYYNLNNNQISLALTKREHTEIGCFGLEDQIENKLQTNQEFKYYIRNDTLTFYFNDKSQLKLIRKEKFNYDDYEKLYKQLNCRLPGGWILMDSLDGEPIYSFAEIPPKLCSTLTPQEFISKNIKVTSRMRTLNVRGKAYLKVLIDKFGNIRGYEAVSNRSCICEDEVYRILGLFPAWEPAYIRDEPINIYYVLVFDFDKLE